MHPTRTILRGAATGILLAVLINGVLFYLLSAIGMIDPGVIIPNQHGPLTLAAVLVSTTLGLVGATLLFLLLVRYTSRPLEYFQLVVLVAGGLSLLVPTFIPLIPTRMAIAMDLLHVVAAAVIYLSLRRAAEPLLTE